MTDAATQVGEASASRQELPSPCSVPTNRLANQADGDGQYLRLNDHERAIDGTPETTMLGGVVARAEAGRQKAVLKPVKDHPFNPYIGFTPNHKDLIASILVPMGDAVKGRRRKRKGRKYGNYCSVLAAVLANALRAAYHPTSQAVHCARAGRTYRRHSENYPDFLKSHNLNLAVDTLEAMGFLVTTVGHYDMAPADERVKVQSTFEATVDLIAFFDGLGITKRDLIRIAPGPVVILRNRKKAELRDKIADPQILEMAQSVRSYNAFLSKVDLSLNLSDAELDKMHSTPQKNGKPRAPINLDDKELCRIFNNSSFKQGGRFYRGWWINSPKAYREHILIDGKPTIEKDFSGCFLRMLYHLKKVEFPVDPYAIPEAKRLADEQGLDWKVVRTAIKRLTNIYLNASKSNNIRFFPDITCDMPEGLQEPERVYALIKEMHEPIAKNFRTGYGVKLMRVESDICAGVLARGMRDGIPVLPIHDSFRVWYDKGDWLEAVMIQAYEDRLPGFLPKIE